MRYVNLGFTYLLILTNTRGPYNGGLGAEPPAVYSVRNKALYATAASTGKKEILTH